MSDDSFIREVDEELRHDRIKGLWSRFGNIIIAVAVLVVLATGAWRGWEYWTARQSSQAGDAFMAAMELAEAGRNDEALAALEQLAAGGYGEYPALARLRIAGELVAQGEAARAMEQFDAIAADSGVDEAFRSVARLRAGLLAVDTESYEQVKARLEPLATGGQAYRSVAREALGLAAWKAGANEEAAAWFRQIADDAEESGNVRDRAALMLDLLAGKGVTGQS